MNLLRKIKIGFDQRSGSHIPAEAPIMERMVEHAGAVINRHLVGGDGKAPCERIRNMKPPLTQIEFGEQAMAKI